MVFSTRVADRPVAGSHAPGAAVGADQHEAVAHHGHDGVRGIPRRCHRADDHDPAFPCQGLSAVTTNIALPQAVIDFAQGGEHSTADIAVGR
jgi:hypothetical protein